MSAERKDKATVAAIAWSAEVAFLIANVYVAPANSSTSAAKRAKAIVADTAPNAEIDKPSLAPVIKRGLPQPDLNGS
jgi:uncharacterized RDD family membrane protein YckC